MRCIGADGAAEELVDLALVADAPAKPPKLTLIRGGKACDDA
jgi:hypothetical protein